MNPTHKSKLHKGFEKQVARQNAKPEYVKIVIVPEILSWNSKHSEYRPLKKKFWNNRWNGMNLKNLCNSFHPVLPTWYGSKRTVNAEGKYILSLKGKEVLNRKRKRKQQLNNE